MVNIKNVNSSFEINERISFIDDYVSSDSDLSKEYANLQFESIKLFTYKNLITIFHHTKIVYEAIKIDTESDLWEINHV